MKLVKTVNFILKALGYILGFGGAIALLGFIGGLDHGQITFGQFFLYALLSCLAMLLAFIVYIIKANFNYYCNKQIKR